MSYGPTPVKRPGSPLHSDDFMSDIAGAMWADWGRGDLQLIKDLGGNTIRMYGRSVRPCEVSALRLGHASMPHVESTGSPANQARHCFCLSHDCWRVIFEMYGQKVSVWQQFSVHGFQSIQAKAYIHTQDSKTHKGNANLLTPKEDLNPCIWT